MTYPEAASGWTRTQRGGEYPGYTRPDGWKIIVHYMDDPQITCSHDSRLYFKRANVHPKDCYWGNPGITARMEWVNTKFGLPSGQKKEDTWRPLALRFLDQVATSSEVPFNVREDAKYLSIMGAV